MTKLEKIITELKQKELRLKKGKTAFFSVPKQELVKKEVVRVITRDEEIFSIDEELQKEVIDTTKDISYVFSKKVCDEEIVDMLVKDDFTVLITCKPVYLSDQSGIRKLRRIHDDTLTEKYEIIPDKYVYSVSLVLYAPTEEEKKLETIRGLSVLESKDKQYDSVQEKMTVIEIATDIESQHPVKFETVETRDDEIIIKYLVEDKLMTTSYKK